MTTVVYFSSTDAGAPVVNNAAGSLIALLDACLINGYGVKPVTSITVFGGVATVVCSAHGFKAGVQEIVGASPAALNGRKNITVAGANGFTFLAPGVPDGLATGVITAKRPGLGWEKRFSAGATKAVYARTDPAATPQVLRVDDTGAGAYAAADAAEVTMYESMSDVDTGLRPIPAAHGQCWVRGEGNAAAARWVLVGDSRTFYLWVSSAMGGGQLANYGTLTTHAFGDIVDYRAGSPYGSILSGPYTRLGGIFGVGVTHDLGTSPNTAGSCYLARGANGLAVGPIAFGVVGHGVSTPGGTASDQPVYPSPVDGGFVASRPQFVSEGDVPFRYPIRGELRGTAEPMANIYSPLAFQTIRLRGSDRDFLVVPTSGTSGSERGSMLVDVTGPWG